MSTYSVQNQWGGSSASWNPGGMWVIGNRPTQNVIALNVTSSDGGKTLTGTMTYAGEKPIGFRGTLTGANNYQVENQWGGSSAPWNPGGTFLLGYRVGQNVIAIDVTSSDGGQSLVGTMTYSGEKPIGFKSELVHGGPYSVENQWGGTSAPWNAGGLWSLGARKGQNIVALKVTSPDGGKTLTGTMTYDGEQPIGFRGSLSGAGTYAVENQWGGTSAAWNPGGQWIIGFRPGQNVVAIDVSSSNGGKTLMGTMTYSGEQPIGFRGTLG
ncbi:lectin ESA-2 [Myxococcus sp. K15C18031901]|uniref:lectin OAA family protein n=1 Tax=Myxococcus dinghuensis TaxID=2906761 RepID=UPI0020A7F359|nr:lectin ESA-2 [Myxococcus dinghuensis]MCP3097298.1 lectin ESA-2 [Myxococcus dinghuensis]